MTIRLLIPIFLLANASFAQSLQALVEQAPPDVDQALRANVTKFYQAHVEGKFRAADQFVAEDSKDFFFGMEKRRCKSFEISKIKYFEEFRRAQAIINCDTDMIMPLGGMMSVKMPVPSRWKLVDGQWQWYVEPPDPKGRQTPFGRMVPRSDNRPQKPLPPPVTIDAVTRAVKADRQEVRLAAASGWSDRVVVTNGMPGVVSLSLEGDAEPGIEAKLDRAELKSGESATLSVRFTPSSEGAPSNTVIRIVIMPTQQVIPVRVRIESSAARPDAR